MSTCKIFAVSLHLVNQKLHLGVFPLLLSSILALPTSGKLEEDTSKVLCNNLRLTIPPLRLGTDLISGYLMNPAPTWGSAAALQGVQWEQCALRHFRHLPKKPRLGMKHFGIRWLCGIVPPSVKRRHLTLFIWINRGFFNHLYFGGRNFQWFAGAAVCCWVGYHMCSAALMGKQFAACFVIPGMCFSLDFIALAFYIVYPRIWAQLWALKYKGI